MEATPVPTQVPVHRVPVVMMEGGTIMGVAVPAKAGEAAVTIRLKICEACLADFYLMAFWAKIDKIISLVKAY